MDELIELIEMNLTDVELVNLLRVAKAALEDPDAARIVRLDTGLGRDDGFALLSNVTDMLHMLED